MQDVMIGFPQRSVLGIFFLTIIMNDLSRNLSVKSVIYADGTPLFPSSNNSDVLQANITLAENEAVNWFTFNKLHCNPEKTQNLLLSLAYYLLFNLNL